MNDLDDMISTTAAAFLGLTVGCAKCHDHKFDPIAQRDYYALAGHLRRRAARRARAAHRRLAAIAQAAASASCASNSASSNASRRSSGCAPSAAGAARRCVRRPRPRRPSARALNVDRFAPVAARFVRFTVLATNELEPCLDELEVFAADDAGAQPGAGQRRRARPRPRASMPTAASSLHRLEHVNDGRYGNSRSWISAEPGARLGADRTGRAGRDRPRRLGARPRGQVSRSAGDALPASKSATTATHWQTRGRRRRSPGLRSRGRAERTPLADRRLAAGRSPSKSTRCARRPTRSARTDRRARAAARSMPARSRSPRRRTCSIAASRCRSASRSRPAAIAAVGPPLALAGRCAGGRAPRGAGPLDRQRRQSAHGAGDGQSHLALSFRPGAGAHAQRFRLQAAAGRRIPSCSIGWPREFVAHGWRLKAAAPAIMLSSTYRQASRHDRTGRGHRRRRPAAVAISAAPARGRSDSRLRCCATSGVLDLRMGGPGYDVFEPNTNYVKVYTPKQIVRPGRVAADGLSEQAAACGRTPRSASSIVPTPARRWPGAMSRPRRCRRSNLLNGPFMVQQAELVRRAARARSRRRPPTQVRRAFRLAFGREPDDDELAAAPTRWSTQQGLIGFLPGAVQRQRVSVPQLSRAAWTMTATTDPAFASPVAGCSIAAASWRMPPAG